MTVARVFDFDPGLREEQPAEQHRLVWGHPRAAQGADPGNIVQFRATQRNVLQFRPLKARAT